MKPAVATIAFDHEVHCSPVRLIHLHVFWQIQYRCSLSAVDGDEDAFVLVFSGGDCRRDIASPLSKNKTKHTNKDRRISWEDHQFAVDRSVQSVVVFHPFTVLTKRSSRISGSYSVQEILLQKQERMKNNSFIKGIHPGRFVVDVHEKIEKRMLIDVTDLRVQISSLPVYAFATPNCQESKQFLFQCTNTGKYMFSRFIQK